MTEIVFAPGYREVLVIDELYGYKEVTSTITEEGEVLEEYWMQYCDGMELE